jgi:hypothetical protein
MAEAEDRTTPAERVGEGDVPRQSADEREETPEEYAARIHALLAAADKRDERAEVRDQEADQRDQDAERDAMIYGPDYNLEDARPFHARRLARKDRDAAGDDRTAAKSDRVPLAESVDGRTRGDVPDPRDSRDQ